MRVRGKGRKEPLLTLWKTVADSVRAWLAGKVELTSTYLETTYGQRLPGYRPYETPYSLLLTSPASDQGITSTFGGGGGGSRDGGRNGADAAPPVEIDPDDARVRALRNGARVRVWNDLGEVHLPVRIIDAVPRAVVFTLKGTWLSTSDNGQTVSALCPGHHADLAEGACYTDTRVEVAG